MNAPGGPGPGRASIVPARGEDSSSASVAMVSDLADQGPLNTASHL